MKNLKKGEEMNLDRKEMDDVLTNDTKAFDERLTNDRLNLTLQEIQFEKEKLDRRYRARLEELEEEKKEQERLYSGKIEQLRNEDQYKEDLIKSQIVKISQEKNSTENDLHQNRDEILNQLHERESDIRQRLDKIKSREEEKDKEIQERLEDLQNEKNKKVQKRMDHIRELQEEIKELEHHYKEKSIEITQDQSYKKDILEERREIEQEIEELKRNSDYRIKEWQREKYEQDELRRQREMTLKSELESVTGHLQDKVNKLEDLKKEQIHEINSKVQALLQEKMKCDELYKLKLEKLRQDEQFKNRELNLQQEIKQQESLYQNKLHDFEKRRIEREEHLKDEVKPDVVTGLVRLKDMKGYKVAKGDSDVRGWDVLGSNNEKIGKVKELIVDPEQMKVRYLDIRVDRSLMDDSEEERNLLIPIGAAVLDEDEDNVLLEALDREMISRLPYVTGDTVTRDYEHTLLTALSTEYNPEIHTNNRFYEQSQFDDAKFYRPRKSTDS